MSKIISLLIIVSCILSFTSNGQNNSLFGLLRTSNPAAIHLGSLDLSAGTFNQISPNSIATSFNITGAALDPIAGSYFFLGTNGMFSVELDSGTVLSQVPLSNPIAPSNFDNFRFNTSNSTLYGLARRYIQGSGPGQGYGELFLATANPSTGVITQISPQSVGESYALQGNAIDPHLMVYYYSIASKFVGLDMYTGLVYSTPNISFPQGGLYFDNFTYNCADTTIYGLIRKNTTAPVTASVYLGKINPQTGVVTQVSQQPLPYNSFTINGSSTIDPTTGTYYFVCVLPQGGNAVIGVSILTGSVVSTNPIPNTGNVQTYFDMMRHPSDCFGAQAYRPNPSGGTANTSNLSTTELNVYPNPFTEQLTIKSDEIIEAFMLKDTQGKIILQDSPNQTELQIQTSELTNGIYFLEIKTNLSTQILKLVK
jgi:hypothetical protein